MQLRQVCVEATDAAASRALSDNTDSSRVAGVDVGHGVRLVEQDRGLASGARNIQRRRR